MTVEAAIAAVEHRIHRPTFTDARGSDWCLQDHRYWVRDCAQVGRPVWLRGLWTEVQPDDVPADVVDELDALDADDFAKLLTPLLTTTEA